MLDECDSTRDLISMCYAVLWSKYIGVSPEERNEVWWHCSYDSTQTINILVVPRVSEKAGLENTDKYGAAV